jgi:hypothetical protein
MRVNKEVISRRSSKEEKLKIPVHGTIFLVAKRAMSLRKTPRDEVERFFFFCVVLSHVVSFARSYIVRCSQVRGFVFVFFCVCLLFRNAFVVERVEVHGDQDNHTETRREEEARQRMARSSTRTQQEERDKRSK